VTSTVTRTVDGFAVTGNGRTVEFSFGHEKDGGIDTRHDAFIRADKTFGWRSTANIKLQLLGLWSPLRADGSAQVKPLPDLRAFLVAAGIVEAPPAPPAPPAPAPSAAPKPIPPGMFAPPKISALQAAINRTRSVIGEDA
jgi:hypothetical protein